MAEETKDKWLNYLSFTTVFIAVCATLASFKGGGYGTTALLSQSNASDQWAYYQSKSIKSYIYETQKENLELQFSTATLNKEVLQKKIDSYAGKIKKYGEEKEHISKEAKGLEAIRDESKAHAERFGMAIIFLQVSILLSSISALTKKKIFWGISVIIGAVGVVYFINGFLIFF